MSRHKVNVIYKITFYICLRNKYGELTEKELPGEEAQEQAAWRRLVGNIDST